jgi:hypothetical protein
MRSAELFDNIVYQRIGKAFQDDVAVNYNLKSEKKSVGLPGRRAQDIREKLSR